jgi:hypothetical protein
MTAATSVEVSKFCFHSTIPGIKLSHYTCNFLSIIHLFLIACFVNSSREVTFQIALAFSWIYALISLSINNSSKSQNKTWIYKIEKGFYLSRACYNDEIQLTWREFFCTVLMAKRLFHFKSIWILICIFIYNMLNMRADTWYPVSI